METLISQIPRWLYAISFIGLGVTSISIGSNLSSYYLDSLIGGALSIYLTGGWMIGVGIDFIVKKRIRLVTLFAAPMLLVSTIWVHTSPYITADSTTSYMGWIFLDFAIIAGILQLATQNSEKKTI